MSCTGNSSWPRWRESVGDDIKVYGLAGKHQDPTNERAWRAGSSGAGRVALGERSTRALLKVYGGSAAGMPTVECICRRANEIMRLVAALLDDLYIRALWESVETEHVNSIQAKTRLG